MKRLAAFQRIVFFLADTMLAQTVRSNGAVSIDVDRAAMKKVD